MGEYSWQTGAEQRELNFLKNFFCHLNNCSSQILFNFKKDFLYLSDNTIVSDMANFAASSVPLLVSMYFIIDIDALSENVNQKQALRWSVFSGHVLFHWMHVLANFFF